MKLFGIQLKKRYIALIVVLMLFGTCRSGLLSFRDSEKEWKQFFEEHQQSDYAFHQVKTGDRTVNYIHAGKEGMPLVVFLHGSPGSASGFKEYLIDKELLAEVQMAAVDRPGNGYSDYGKSVPSFDGQAEQMKPILEQHKAPFTILVGHSLGGPIVVKMAANYTDLVDGLVILAGSIDPDLEPKEWHRKPLNTALIRWMIPRSFMVSNQEIMEAKAELIKMLPEWEEIEAPVTILQGEEDRLVPKGNADFGKKMLVNSEKVAIQMFEKENHFIVWSRYEEVKRAILEMKVHLQNKESDAVIE